MPGQHYVLFADDTQATEALLRDQPGILDANVWYANHQMVAQVTLDAESQQSPIALQRICRHKLGLAATPSVLFMVSARQRAA